MVSHNLTWIPKDINGKSDIAVVSVRQTVLYLHRAHSVDIKPHGTEAIPFNVEKLVQKIY